ncbi:MAG: iron chaperone [Candidatus Saccharibacteria bacterium]
MPMNMPVVKDTDEYILQFPAEVQVKLQELRAVIKQAAPEAEETISYAMPAYKQKGIVVYFAGHKNHIGFYPAASGVVNFEKELSGYTTSKGTVQFQLNKPLPLELIKKIVEFRVAENLQKAELKKKRKQ